jgi:hypothetical protein
MKRIQILRCFIEKLATHSENNEVALEAIRQDEGFSAILCLIGGKPGLDFQR